MAKIKEKEAREALERVIQRQFDIATTSDEEGKSTNAANTYKSLLKDYKELFGFAPEEVSELKVVKKKISGFKG